MQTPALVGTTVHGDGNFVYVSGALLYAKLTVQLPVNGRLADLDPDAPVANTPRKSTEPHRYARRRIPTRDQCPTLATPCLGARQTRAASRAGAAPRRRRCLSPNRQGHRDRATSSTSASQARERDRGPRPTS